MWSTTGIRTATWTERPVRTSDDRVPHALWLLRPSIAVVGLGVHPDERLLARRDE